MDQKQITRLVERSRSGDRAAQEELIAAVQNYVYFHCCKLLDHRENALDVTQEVLITMVTSLPKLQEPAAFRAWLLKIIYSRCKNQQIRGPKECQIPETEDGDSLLDIWTEDSAEAIPDQALDNAETVRILRELVDQLTPGQRDCVLLYYYDELKLSEIAAVLSVPESTVKNRLYHARKALKEGILQYERSSGRLYTLSLAPLLAYLLHSEAQAGAMTATESASLTASALAAGGAAVKTTAAAAWIKAAACAAILGVAVGGVWLARDLRRTKPPEEIVEESQLSQTAAEVFSTEELALLQSYVQEHQMVDDALALTDCNGDGQWELFYSGGAYLGESYGTQRALLTVENGAVVRRELDLGLEDREGQTLRGYLVVTDEETGRTILGWIDSESYDGSKVTLKLFHMDDAYGLESPVTWTGSEEELISYMSQELSGPTVLTWFWNNRIFEDLMETFPARTARDNLDLLQFPEETVSLWGGNLLLSAPQFWLEDVEYQETRDPDSGLWTATFWSRANRLDDNDSIGYLLSLEQTPHVSHTLALWDCGPGGSIPGSLQGHAVMLVEPTDYRAHTAMDQYNQDRMVALAVCEAIAWEPESMVPEDAATIPEDYALYVVSQLESALSDHALTFDRPSELTDDTLVDLTATWMFDRQVGSLLHLDAWAYENDDGSYTLPEDVIRQVLDMHLQEYDLDITQCSGYDPQTKTVHWEQAPYDGSGLSIQLLSTQTAGDVAYYTVDVTVTQEDETIFSQQKVYAIEYNRDGWFYQSVTQVEPEKASSAFRPVLQGETNFVDADTSTARSVEDLRSLVTSDPAVTVEAQAFTVLDLGGDGATEVALKLGPNETYGFVVLWEEAGTVYGQWLPSRAFQELKADGTFTMSGGAGDWGIGNLSFADGTCRTESSTRVEGSTDYYVDGQSADQEAFEQETRRQSQKTDAVWYAWTDDNVERYCS